MWGSQQLTIGGISPAVQGADNVAAHVGSRGLQIATTFEHHRLSVAANIGDQFDALCVAHQRPAFMFLGQGHVITHLGHGQGMTDITRTLLKQQSHFALIKRLVKIACNWELARGLLQLKT